MSPPPNSSGLDHPLIGTALAALGWILASLLTLLAVLVGWDRKTMTNKTSALFRWKDDVVDPALKDIPKLYVSKHDLEVYVHRPNAEDHKRILDELGNQREMLEELLKR